MEVPSFPLLTPNNNVFAHTTMSVRLPTIITKCIDTLHREAINLTELTDSTELTEIIAKLAQLKYEVSHDKNLTNLPEDVSHSSIWNYQIGVYLKSLGDSESWFSAPWLLAECYLYKRINVCFEQSTHFKDFDEALTSSQPAILTLLSKIYGNSSILDLKITADRAALKEFVQYSLWGNQSDLSLNIHSHQLKGMHAEISRHHSEKVDNLIVNNLEPLVQYLLSKNNVRIDIILDNSGFELLVDLLLADHLIKSGVASKVVFHVKDYPYFVSDVTNRDFSLTISAITSLIENEEWSGNVTWKEYLASGKWSVESDSFWTLGYSFRYPSNLRSRTGKWTVSTKYTHTSPKAGKT